jgi:hypothetical protein
MIVDMADGAKAQLNCGTEFRICNGFAGRLLRKKH